jgi:hypothetical protein
MADCFECGKPAENNHHVVPKSRGGTKTVPLCAACHALIHDKPITSSQLTKDGLAAAKAHGTLLGSARPSHWDGREAKRLVGLRKARQSAATAIREAARDACADLVPLITEMRAAGQSLQAIADALTAQGHVTRRGMPWNPTQVRRLLIRNGYSCPKETRASSNPGAKYTGEAPAPSPPDFRIFIP